jgi:2,4-dienoyl-CoA reductase-like NADH-dependent reductase (Old Yellow Enzyme family)
MVPEIEKVKEGLKRETRFVEVAGLKGIQINGTHGFLLG